jgi:hypothetical protein
MRGVSRVSAGRRAPSRSRASGPRAARSPTRPPVSLSHAG